MIVGSFKENIALEKRVSLTPESGKKHYWTWIKSLYRKRLCTSSGYK